MIGVYKIENKINGHLYIGQSFCIERRFLEHKSELKRNIHHNERLQNAWNLYGENAFSFAIIKECKDREELNYYETYFVENYKKDKGRDFVYNLGRTGDAKNTSDETRKKLSENNAMNNPLYRLKISLKNKGRKMSDETKEKLRQNHLGKKLSEETKRKISLNSAKSMLGKHHTEEARKKMKESSTKREWQLYRCIETGEIGTNKYFMNKIGINNRHTITNAIANRKGQKTAKGYHFEKMAKET